MKNAFDLIITTPLGYILTFIYSLVKNYGLTIIIFTIVVKLLLMPLLIKQQKSMVATQKLQPELAKIQKKYANDKQRLNEETMKLYQENNVNPAGGCLPLLIQFPIIIGLYQVINRPLLYIMNLSLETIAKITELLGFSWTGKSEIAIAKAMESNLGLLAEKLGQDFSDLIINFDFFGLDLSMTPSFSRFDALWLIPILSALFAYLSGVVSSKLSGNAQANDQMKSMNVIMPLMSAYFCFIMPSGVGIYWIMSSLLQVVQQVVITKILLKKAEGETLNVKHK